MIEHFSTLNLQPGIRVKFWNSVCDSTLPGTCVDSPCEGFRASMRRWAWSTGEGAANDLVLVRPRSDASRVWRRAMTEQAGDEKLVMHFLHRGSARFVHKHYDIPLSDGEFILTPGRLGYHFTLSQGHELLVAEIPVPSLLERMPELDAHLCTNIASTPATRLFQEFVLSLWRHSETSADDTHASTRPAWQMDALHSFYDLLAMALRHRQTAPALHGRRGERLFSAAQAFVESHLTQSDLSSTHIAQALGVSVRTIQSLFAAASCTPSIYIQNRRLTHAADRLRTDPQTPITALAFELGFNDSAYFSRCFHKRFGISPRQWRQQ